MTCLEVVVFFDIFGAIGATVLTIIFEKLKLLKSGIDRIPSQNLGFVRNRQKRGRHHETVEIAKTARSFIHFPSCCGFFGVEF